MTKDNLHRISFAVEDDLYEKAMKIPWGLRAAVLRKLLSVLVDSADKNGQMIYGAILDGKFTFEHRD